MGYDKQQGKQQLIRYDLTSFQHERCCKGHFSAGKCVRPALCRPNQGMALGAGELLPSKLSCHRRHIFLG